MPGLFDVGLLTEDEVTVSPIKDENEQIQEVVKKEEPKEVEKKEESKEGEVKKEVKDLGELELLTEDEVENKPDELEVSEETGKKTVKKTEKQEKPDKPTTPDSEYFKTLAQFHIDNGDWEEWENWKDEKDKVEFTPEVFADMQKEQVQLKVQKALEEKESAYGSQYKQLIEYAKTGAPVQNLYSSFQEQADIEALDPENVDDAEKIVESYYDSLGWEKSEIREEIDALKDRGEDKLKLAANKRKGDLVKAITEDRETELQRAKAFEAERKANTELFNKKVREYIHKDEVPEREKKEMEKFLFEYKYQNESGQKFTEYDKVSSEIRNNPEKFYQFAAFLKNPDKFGSKEKVEKETKKNIFTTLRSAQADIGKNKSTETPEMQKSKNSGKGQYNPFKGFLNV